MPVTCSFTRKMGYVWIKDKDDKPVKCDIWAGGNCMMVVTWSKAKHLQAFFSDMRHLKACLKDDWFKTGMTKMEIPVDLGYSKEIAATLAKAGIPVTLFPAKHVFR